MQFVHSNSILKGPKHFVQGVWTGGRLHPEGHSNNTEYTMHSSTCVMVELELRETAYRDNSARETEEQPALREGNEVGFTREEQRGGLQTEMALGFLLDGVSSQVFYMATPHTS